MARRTPSVLTALHKALRDTTQVDRDAATVALAKRYARELDDAALISVATSKALAKLRDVEGAGEIHDQLLALAARIEEAHVAALIGPKLLAALEQLHMTPGARGESKGGTGDNRPKSALDELRARREGRTASLDTSVT